MPHSLLQSAYRELTRVNSDDPDLVRRGRLLNPVIAGVLLPALLILIVQGLIGSGAALLVDILFALVLIAVSISALWISRTGNPRRAAYLFLGVVWLALTVGLFASGSLEEGFRFTPFMFAVPVVVSGLTAGRAAPFLFTALAIAAMSATALILPSTRPGGATGPVAAAPYGNVASFALYLLIMAFLSFMFERTGAAALRETGQRAQNLAETRADLARQRREEQLAAAMRAQAADLARAVQLQNAAITAQQAAAQEVTITVEELAAAAREITATARQVSAAARRVLGSVERGEASVSTTGDAVGYLSERVTAIRERVQTVNGHVQQINEIADLLTEIGDNIHLLALNATIEAAGAGPYGTRFAVVAHEVQELADRVRVASGQVRSQVLDIQTATASALVSAEAGQTAAESAVSQAAQTRDVHVQIHQTAEQASALAAQIAAGTDQQQTASAQVLATLRDITYSARELAEESDRVAAAAARLSSLAAELEAEQQVSAAAALSPPAAALSPPAYELVNDGTAGTV